MVHIVSWNVAGLTGTLRKIHNDFIEDAIKEAVETTATTTTTTPNDGAAPKPPISNKAMALDYFLMKHDIDILCIQEHKIPKSQLSTKSEAFGIASNLTNYDTYWACSTHKSSKGMNGVCTFVKRGIGLDVISANGTSVLEDEEFDTQGRILLTNHGCFSLINIYVPQGGSCGLGAKLKFLNLLRTKMQSLRNQSIQPLILVGDYNISYQPQDMYWKYRLIDINYILKEVQEEQLHYKRSIMTNATGSGSTTHDPVDELSRTNSFVNPNIHHNTRNCATTTTTSFLKHPSNLPKWKLDIARYWNLITDVLKHHKRAVPIQTKNTFTNETFDKYNTVVDIELCPPSSTSDDFENNEESNKKPKSNSNGIKKSVVLGRARDTEEEALMVYDVRERYYVDPDTNLEKVARHANVIDLENLTELMSKIANVEWSTSTQRLIVSSGENLHIYHSQLPTVQWFDTLLKKDQMMDTFRLNYPTTEGRFTCWHQYLNKRYDNIGTRLDYILVDRELVKYVQQGSRVIDCGKLLNSQKVDPCSDEAAWHAVTASGGYQGASFDKSGIASPTKDVLEHQFGFPLSDQNKAIPHTGMIYMPPTYSDHIAVSLLFNNNVITSTPSSETATTKLSSQDKSLLKKTQPHLSQSSITSFFGVSKSKSNTTISTKSTKEKKHFKRKTIKTLLTDQRLASATTTITEGTNQNTTTTNVVTSKTEETTINKEQQQDSNTRNHHQTSPHHDNTNHDTSAAIGFAPSTSSISALSMQSVGSPRRRKQPPKKPQSLSKIDDDDDDDDDIFSNGDLMSPINDLKESIQETTATTLNHMITNTTNTISTAVMGCSMTEAIELVWQTGTDMLRDPFAERIVAQHPMASAELSTEYSSSFSPPIKTIEAIVKKTPTTNYETTNANTSTNNKRPIMTVITETTTATTTTTDKKSKQTTNSLESPMKKTKFDVMASKATSQEQKQRTNTPPTKLTPQRGLKKSATSTSLSTNKSGNNTPTKSKARTKLGPLDSWTVNRRTRSTPTPSKTKK